MTEKTAEARRKPASEYRTDTMSPTPWRFPDGLHEAGLLIGSILVLIGLFQLVVDRILVSGLVITAVGAVSIGLVLYTNRSDGTLRQLHIVNVDDEPLRFTLEISERDSDERLVRHEYELPAGECAVHPNSYERGTAYTVAISFEDGERMRTTATPVRATADPDASTEFVVEIDRTSVRSRLR